MAKASSMRRFGHVFRKEENVIAKALKFQVSSSSRGRPKQMWKRQVQNEIKKMEW